MLRLSSNSYVLRFSEPGLFLFVIFLVNALPLLINGFRERSHIHIHQLSAEFDVFPLENLIANICDTMNTAMNGFRTLMDISLCISQQGAYFIMNEILFVGLDIVYKLFCGMLSCKRVGVIAIGEKHYFDVEPLL